MVQSSFARRSPRTAPLACGPSVRALAWPVAVLALALACGGDDAEPADGSVAAGGGSMAGAAGGEMGGAGGAGMEAAGGADMGAATAEEAFAETVHPIFAESCVPCHAAEHAHPDVDIAFNTAISPSGEGTFMDLILDRVGPEEPQLGTGSRMPLGSCNGPPGTSGCLTEAEYDALQAWYDAWLAEAPAE